MLEAQVHEQLRAFLRHHGNTEWPHHLTMARLAARALRLGRSSLMQVGSAALYQGHYRLSYLMSLLLWPDSAILLLPEAFQQRVRLGDIPRLQEWMPTHKAVHWGDAWPDEQFRGLLVTTPGAWLRDRCSRRDRFPTGVPVFVDGVDDLEAWIQQVLTVTLDGAAWQMLMQAYPQHHDLIQDAQVSLTHGLFQHPPNPYHCHLLETAERQVLLDLGEILSGGDQIAPMHPLGWKQFWQQMQQSEQLVWAHLDREQGRWTLNCAPMDVAIAMREIWSEQPLVLMGGALDSTPEATHYRQRLGLGDMTCLKFNPDRHTEEIRLYLPDHLPLPNTREFQSAVLTEVGHLVIAHGSRLGLRVVLVEDTPLKQQVGAELAAQFGSRVQVETQQVDEQGILVSGWHYWRSHAPYLPPPSLLVVVTLPLPSLENPMVAGQVAHYKRSRQDWFRLYLLPTAMGELQRAIAPVRANQGIVAILDNRVNHRSYGSQILDGLSPAVRFRHPHHLWLADRVSSSSPSRPY